MDWKTLFFAPEGRIGRRDFWIGFAVLLGVNLVLALVPGVGQLVHLVSIYVWVCLSAKRLHDMGRTGWLTALPYVVWALAASAIMVTGGAALITAAISGSQSAALSTALGALGIASLAFGAAFLFGLAFLLWVGLTASTPGDNRYGPPPVALVTGA